MKKLPSENQAPKEIAGFDLPKNLEAEDYVIAALLLSGEERLAVFEIITTEKIFYKEENQLCFLAIKAMHEKGDQIDMISLIHEMKLHGTFQSVGVKYIASLMTKISQSIHAEMHARIILECWMRRCLIATTTELTRSCYDDSQNVFDLLNQAEKTIQDNTGLLFKQSESTFEQIADQAIRNIALAASDALAGIPSGLKEIDERLSGLCAPDLIIIASRPGGGKSSLIFSIIADLGFNNIPTGLITLEMNEEQVFNRMVSIQSGIFSSKIRNRKDLDAEDKQRYNHFALLMKKWPIYMNSTANTISKLRVKATIWKNKYGIKALFVDYLQLMSGQSKQGQNREGEISDISRGLKQLANTLQIPIIALSQLSRKVEERGSKMPQLSDLRESGSIEQDADFVLFLMRPEYYKMTGSVDISGDNYSVQGLCIADLAKSRHSDTGEFPLKFNGPIMKFSDYSEFDIVEPTLPLTMKNEDAF